jgi:histidyl-tRNA synthetase
MVDARTLKGFRDLLPEQAAARERAIATLRRVFRNAGFAPIDTPSLELTEVLAAKADDESDSQKLMYRFIDHGGRDIGLRYDLTVPLARFVSQHRSEITYPFARYQIGTVWRAEKPQAGRYREFTQCDFDIVGSDTFESDFTVVSTAARAVQALVDQPAVLRINDRRLLAGVLRGLDIAPDHHPAALRALDRFDKVGAGPVIDDLSALTPATPTGVARLVEALTSATAATDLLEHIPDADHDLVAVASHLDLLIVTLNEVIPAPVEATFDALISRGLDYYTGIVFETFLTEHRTIGSVCSGGRYDSLLAEFGQAHTPAVGGSVGLDRLLSITTGHVGRDRPAVYVIRADTTNPTRAVTLAEAVRDRGLTAVVDYRPYSSNTGRQKAITRAGTAHARFVAIIDTDDDTIQLRDLDTGTTTTETLTTTPANIAQRCPPAN